MLYKKKWIKSKHPGIPVISVGNLRVGGTGQTPMVSFLTQSAKDYGLKPAIISRGYQNRSQTKIQRVCYSENGMVDPVLFGDEPSMLAKKNPDIPVYVSKSRLDAAKKAKEWDDPGLLILDDAYQHLAVKRDLNLLLVDAERGFGNKQLLPKGPLREPLKSAGRADAVIVTKVNLGSVDEVIQSLQEYIPKDCPVFLFEYRILKISRLDGLENKDASVLGGKSVIISSGIAHPKSFSKILKHEKAQLVSEMHFKDHHHYSEASIQKMVEWGNSNPHDFWLTTEKDAIKLRSIEELMMKLWVVEMEIYPDPEWQSFFSGFLEGLNGNEQMEDSHSCC